MTTRSRTREALPLNQSALEKATSNVHRYGAETSSARAPRHLEKAGSPKQVATPVKRAQVKPSAVAKKQSPVPSELDTASIQTDENPASPKVSATFTACGHHRSRSEQDRLTRQGSTEWEARQRALALAALKTSKG